MVNSQNSITIKMETTQGTYNAPMAADSNIRIFGEPKGSITFGNESVGVRADGTMNAGVVSGKFRKLEVAEFFAQMLAPTDETVAPNWYKLAILGGYTQKTFPTGRIGLNYDGLPSCDTASVVLTQSGCGKGETLQGRGMKGVASIYFDGANGEWFIKLAGLAGALNANPVYGTTTPVTLTGENTTLPQRAGMYIFNLFGVAYQVSKLEITLGLTVAQRPKNDVTGIEYSQVTKGSDAKITATLKKLDGASIANNNVYTIAQANTSGTITLLGQSAVGGAYDITLTGCQLSDPASGDIDGFAAFDISAQFSNIDIVPIVIP